MDWDKDEKWLLNAFVGSQYRDCGKIGLAHSKVLHMGDGELVKMKREQNVYVFLAISVLLFGAEVYISLFRKKVA